MAKITRTAVKLDEKRLEMFWQFVCERQNIYWRRENGDKWPWTDDCILRKHFFCNVYREEDRGTQFYISRILKKSKNYAYYDIVFKTLMYRLFNEPFTYRYIEHLMKWYNGRKAATILDRKHDAGIRIFRSAWMTSGANITGSKARAYCLDMDRVFKNRLDLTNKLMSVDSMEDAWKIISSIKWFGSFSSYQVVLDLSYIPRFRNRWKDFDTWVYPGPGAKLGLLWLMGHSPAKRKGAGVKDKITYEQCETLIHYLAKHQQRSFDKYGLNFVGWKGQWLNIHNIEFALCEFNKYMRAQHGGKKRKFVPRED